jgi:hypothetical protein
MRTVDTLCCSLLFVVRIAGDSESRNIEERAALLLIDAKQTLIKNKKNHKNQLDFIKSTLTNKVNELMDGTMRGREDTRGASCH